MMKKKEKEKERGKEEEDFSNPLILEKEIKEKEPGPTLIVFQIYMNYNLLSK